MQRIADMDVTTTAARSGAVVVIGMLSLLAAIGVSRFGYGVLIPSLMEGGGISANGIGLVGMMNLLGYLVGCVALMLLPVRANSLTLIQVCLVGSVATLAALALSGHLYWWSLMRFVNGVFGGAVFILVSVSLVGELSRGGRHLHSAPLMYSGVGLGILLSAVTGTWNLLSVNDNLLLWSAFGVVSVAVVHLLSRSLPRTCLVTGNARSGGLRANTSAVLLLFVLSYAMEGMGYIVYASYVFPYQMGAQASAEFALTAWAALGVGAALGPILVWHYDARGAVHRAVYALFLGQAAAVAFTVATHGVYLSVFSAFVFGVSFMGITSAYIFLAKKIWPGLTSGAAVLTVAYSCGQAVGPVLGASVVQDSQIGGPTLGLSLGLVLIATGLFAAADKRIRDGELEVNRNAVL